MVAGVTIAVTGGTGFVGSALIRLAADRGIEMRALARRTQPAMRGVEWVAGALDRDNSLATLLEGADAVIHVAGAVNAPDRAGFAAVNVAGTEATIRAAGRAGVRRFVHVSSLAAREPALSDYGWSKAGAEAAVTASALDWTIVRPPAVYGPGDREFLPLFRLARRGLAVLPPGGRLSLIHVDDLARLLLALAGTDATGRTFEPDDGVAGGWSYPDFGRAIGEAVGRRVATLAVPRALLGLGARLDRFVRGPRARLTADRVAYFCHPDWVADPAKQPPLDLWRSKIDTRAGLAATADWYRAQGWLSGAGRK